MKTKHKRVIAHQFLNYGLLTNFVKVFLDEMSQVPELIVIKVYMCIYNSEDPIQIIIIMTDSDSPKHFYKNS